MDILEILAITAFSTGGFMVVMYTLHKCRQTNRLKESPSSDDLVSISDDPVAVA